MTNLGGIFLDTTELDKLKDDIKPNVGKLVERFGLLVTTDAAKNAPVDTGALRNSILSESDMVSEMTFRVQDGVEYGVFQELGTSRMAAHPFIVPAIEKWREKFYAAFKELFK